MKNAEGDTVDMGLKAGRYKLFVNIILPLTPQSQIHALCRFWIFDNLLLILLGLHSLLELGNPFACHSL